MVADPDNQIAAWGSDNGTNYYDEQCPAAG
jgi:hypothetical protein